MSSIIIQLIRAYQYALSPLLPQNTCRFHPTCSEYAIESIRKLGLTKGIVRGVRRILKCHPFHPGGFDPA